MASSWRVCWKPQLLLKPLSNLSGTSQKQTPLRRTRRTLMLRRLTHARHVQDEEVSVEGKVHREEVG